MKEFSSQPGPMPVVAHNHPIVENVGLSRAEERGDRSDRAGSVGLGRFDFWVLSPAQVVSYLNAER